MRGKRVLVVDDEPSLIDVVRAYLERDGARVDAATTGQGALRCLAEAPPDLVILDLMLPDMTGEEVCRRVRLQSDVPIIMLTAKTAVEEMVGGLGMGADDYVTKPFSPKVLSARVRAVLRRAHGDSPLVERMSFDSGAFRIDMVQRAVTVNGTEVALTPTEFALVSLLAKNPGRVWGREELITRVRGYDYEGADRAIDAHIKKLRAKLDDDSRQPRWILTAWGTGYKFGGKPDV